jgi:hypothetical protein
VQQLAFGRTAGRAAMRGVAAGLLALASLLAAATAEAAPPPIHLGVDGCAGSGCHGNAQPSDKTSVQQNEVTLWRARDPHARAWNVLKEPRGQRIARILGLGDADSARECLACHADNTPADMRGQMFKLSDGVGCEACHAASAPWLGLHASGIATHEQNVAAGLYPTEQPKARAELCLGCHLGDGSRFISHDIMAAGHPALRFELDTYTNTEPPHWRVDADYLKRKGRADRIGTWATGQLVAADRTLSLIGERFGAKGRTPELGVFDCAACHKPMAPGSYDSAAGRGIGPGVPRLADANLVMVRVLLQAFDPGAASAMRKDWVALHAASRGGSAAVARAVEPLRTRIASAGGFGTRGYDLAARRRLLATFVEEADAGRLSDYSVAQQTTMALGTIVAGLRESGLGSAQFQETNAALDTVYGSIADEKTFDGRKWTAAVRRLGATLATD